jgi:hypothetical protein
MTIAELEVHAARIPKPINTHARVSLCLAVPQVASAAFGELETVAECLYFAGHANTESRYF